MYSAAPLCPSQCRVMGGCSAKTANDALSPGRSAAAPLPGRRSSFHVAKTSGSDEWTFPTALSRPRLAAQAGNRPAFRVFCTQLLFVHDRIPRPNNPYDHASVNCCPTSRPPPRCGCCVLSMHRSSWIFSTSSSKAPAASPFRSPTSTPLLVAYLEVVQESTRHALRDKPETYLATWCVQRHEVASPLPRGGTRRPGLSAHPHTEDVFAFLDRALAQDVSFVGTESRLRLVIDTLADLVVGASDDPETRLAQLRAEKPRIERGDPAHRPPRAPSPATSRPRSASASPPPCPC